MVKGRSMFGGAECGPVKEIFWQGSRMIGVITMTFIIAFGIWTFVSLWVKDAKSPFELLGVRPVENCQAYINEDFVVDCSVAQCPRGCVRGNSSPGNARECEVTSDCGSGEICSESGRCVIDGGGPNMPGPNRNECYEDSDCPGGASGRLYECSPNGNCVRSPGVGR